MAEFAASILGIVSCGAKVTLVLSQIASDVGSAGKEARMIGSEIRSFCAIIKTLGDTLGKIQASQYYDHCADLIEPMTETSMEMFTEILNASDHLKGITKGKDKKDDKFGLVKRVQWAVFQKPKIMVLRAAIEAYKSNLALMLATLNTAEKVARIMPAQVSEDLILEEENDRSLLQSLELEHRASMLELEEVEQEYRRSVTDQASNSFSNELRDAPPASDETVSVDPLPPYEKTWIDDLVGSAREEIESMRSSFSSNYVFDIAEIQGQVSRQSKTLSLLLAEDHRRISQRWSSVLSLSVRHSSRLPGTDGSQQSETHEHHSKRGGASEVSTFGPESSSQPVRFQDPFYHQVTMWLMQYPKADRTTILKGLEQEVSESLGKPPIEKQTKRSETAPSKTHKGHLPGPDAKLIRVLVMHQVTTYKSSSWSSPYVEISLSDMNIFEVPGDIFLDWSYRLKSMDLSHNKLTNLPRAINSAYHLRHLDLKYNRFQHFPPVLYLDTLEYLDISHNKLEYLPSGISNMKVLKFFSIEHNSIRGLPLELGDLPRLNLLKYGGNPIYFPSFKAIETFMPERYAPTPKGEDEACIHATKRVKAFLKMTFKLSPDAERAIKGLLPDSPKIPIDPGSTEPHHTKHPSTARTEFPNRVTTPIEKQLYPEQFDGRRQSGLWSPTVTITRPPAEDRFDFPSFAHDKPPPNTIENLAQAPFTPGLTTGLIPIGLGHRKAQSHDVSNRGPTVFPHTGDMVARRLSYNGLALASISSLSDGSSSASLAKPAPPASDVPRGGGNILRSHKSRPSLNILEKADELLNRAKRRP